MRPETAQFIDNARKMLERGRLMLEVPLYEDAGRAAYLACFHVAQALIFEREQRILKAHYGSRDGARALDDGRRRAGRR